MTSLEKLEKKINYEFKDKSYLSLALTHSSYKYEKNISECNERLEFLGDAVLSIISARFLYDRFPEMSEGSLSKLRSSLVCTSSLAEFAGRISLGSYMKLGNGEKKLNNGECRPALLEDAFEALIGAIYLDGGIDCAKTFVLSFLKPAVETHHLSFRDYKSSLQEFMQHNPDQKIKFVLVNETGPQHDKLFEVEVMLNSNVIGKGKGKSKKSAEQMAAKEALELMGL